LEIIILQSENNGRKIEINNKLEKSEEIVNQNTIIINKSVILNHDIDKNAIDKNALVKGDLNKIIIEKAIIAPYLNKFNNLTNYNNYNNYSNSNNQINSYYNNNNNNNNNIKNENSKNIIVPTSKENKYLTPKFINKNKLNISHSQINHLNNTFKPKTNDNLHLSPLTTNSDLQEEISFYTNANDKSFEHFNMKEENDINIRSIDIIELQKAVNKHFDNYEKVPVIQGWIDWNVMEKYFVRFSDEDIKKIFPILNREYYDSLISDRYEKIWNLMVKSTNKAIINNKEVTIGITSYKSNNSGESDKYFIYSFVIDDIDRYNEENANLFSGVDDEDIKQKIKDRIINEKKSSFNDSFNNKFETMTNKIESNLDLLCNRITIINIKRISDEGVKKLREELKLIENLRKRIGFETQIYIENLNEKEYEFLINSEKLFQVLDINRKFAKKIYSKVIEENKRLAAKPNENINQRIILFKELTSINRCFELKTQIQNGIIHKTSPITDEIKECLNNADPIEADCCVCMSDDTENTNEIIFCDFCNVSVHTECYGLSVVPQDSFFCDICLSRNNKLLNPDMSSGKETSKTRLGNYKQINQETEDITCMLCCQNKGAMKSICAKRNLWGHVICILVSKLIHFNNFSTLKTFQDFNIDVLTKTLSENNYSCFLCKKSKGELFICQCSNTCNKRAHYLCAYMDGWNLKVKDTLKSMNVNIRGYLIPVINKEKITEILNQVIQVEIYCENQIRLANNQNYSNIILNQKLIRGKLYHKQIEIATTSLDLGYSNAKRKLQNKKKQSEIINSNNLSRRNVKQNSRGECPEKSNTSSAGEHNNANWNNKMDIDNMDTNSISNSNSNSNSIFVSNNSYSYQYNTNYTSNNAQNSLGESSNTYSNSNNINQANCKHNNI